MIGVEICKYNKFGFCKFGNTCLRKHENTKCENKSIWNCSLRHPRSCKYFREYKRCKFGDFCKFSHDIFVDEDVEKIRVELGTLKIKIANKDKEIEQLNEKMENLMNHLSEKITKLEEINIIIRKELENVKKVNEALRCSMSKDIVNENENIETVENNEDIDLNIDVVLKCDKCDFIGKTEAGLKTHNTVKHKVSLMRMYRKV